MEQLSLLNSKKILPILVFGIVTGASIIWLLLLFFQTNDYTYDKLLTECDKGNISPSSKVTCWLEVIRPVLEEKGIEEAFDVFGTVYRKYEDFANTACHLSAHRVGDMAYDTYYLPYQDITKVNFSKNSIACGYGFYHGFIEHLVQNIPEPAFVEKNCEYLTDSLSEIAPGLRSVCYHAGGHGFILAQAENIRSEEGWTKENFTTEPLEKCDALNVDDDYLRVECRQGVYNIMQGWMETGDYGLYYDAEAPYAYCDTLDNKDHQYDCYVEATRKIEYGSGIDPLKAYELIASGNRTDMEEFLLLIAVAGMVQKDPNGSQEFLIEQCRKVPGYVQESCFTSIVHGLFEHGIPDAEYKLADALCRGDILNPSEVDMCYGMVVEKLDRFRSPEEIDSLCTQGLLSNETCTLRSSR